MLTVAIEGHIILTKDPLEQIRSNNLRIINPHLTYKFGPSLNKSTLSSKWILILSIYQRLVPLLQEVLRKFERVRQALNAAVHIASVAKVGQPYQTLLRIVSDGVFVILLQLIISLSTTLIYMKFPVLFHAIFITILYIFTFANGSQNISITAILACTYHQLLSFLKLESEWHAFTLSVFDNNYLTFVKINLVNPECCVQQWLH